MLRHILGSRWTIQILATISMIVTGCGGSTAIGGTDTTTGGQSPAEAAAAEAAADPKLEEAKQRCEQEIEKSNLQPPDTLASIQVHACIYAVREEIAKCTKGPKRDLVIKIVADKTGEVLNAFPVGDTADCPEATCVAEVIKEITFPKFKGQTQQIIKYPFTLGE
ncbi:MAG: hypothetical protein GY847_15590 [Proteobacteria bacterium]|nr:hypothetical protein [Pseudomonadota bacterium]